LKTLILKAACEIQPRTISNHGETTLHAATNAKLQLATVSAVVIFCNQST